MPKQITVKGRTYYSLPEASRRVGVHRKTMYRWATKNGEVKGLRLKVIKDRFFGHYFISAGSVRNLVKKREHRFQKVNVASARRKVREVN